jgi:hypothetical protein
MSLLNTNFDIISHDPHPNAPVGLLTLLDVEGAPLPGSGGTPVAGTINPGSIVAINPATGKAVLADNANAMTNAPCMLFVTVDGDVDFDGAFFHRITCIQGGVEIQTEQFVAGTYTVGDMLTCGSGSDAGKFRAAASGEQIYGVVGVNGYDATKATLHVVIPQGISPAIA